MVSGQVVWPLMVTGAECTSFDKMCAIGCHPVWGKRTARPDEELADAIWRATHRTIWCGFVSEILNRRDLWFEKDVITSTTELTTEAPHLVAGSRLVDIHREEDGLPGHVADFSENWWFRRELDSRVGRFSSVNEALQRVHQQAQGWGQ